MFSALMIAKLLFLDLNPEFSYAELLPQEQAQQMREWMDRESEEWRLYIQTGNREDKPNEYGK
jgi:hypothetical protein